MAIETLKRPGIKLYPIEYGPEKIILTSFRDREHWQGIPLSVARWNPEGAKNIERIKFFAPFYNGKKMVNMMPDDYRQKYEEILTKNADQIDHFLRSYDGYTLTLLCWCYLERKSKYPLLFCHRILIGYYIEDHYPWIPVEYLDGADKPVWERVNGNKKD